MDQLIPIIVAFLLSTASSSPTSGMGIPKPSSDGSCSLINPLCHPKGFNVDYYHNDFYQYGRSDSGVLSNYYIVQGLSPLESSIADTTVFPQTRDFPNACLKPNASLPADFACYYPGWTRVLYGMTIDPNNFTFVYQGFYKAPTTGTYQLCTSADNENDIYFGDGNAFSCRTGLPPTSANPMTKSFIPRQVCAAVTMTQGRFYPFRAVMGNYQGPASVDFSIFPHGTTVPNRSNNFSGLAYPYKCGIFLPF